VRVRQSKWQPAGVAPGLFRPRVQESRDVPGVRFANVEVRHRRAGCGVLRIANPALHVRRLVGKVAADDRANRDAVERRSDHARGGAHVSDGMTAATTVLDEQGLAAARVTAGLHRGMHAHPIALFGIFHDDADESHYEQQRRQQAEEGLSGQKARDAPPPT